MKLIFDKIYTLSNFISFFRVLLAFPVYYYVSNLTYLPEASTVLLVLYFLAYLSDILDGYFARKLNQITELGKIIDPLADKILVIMTIIYFYYFGLIDSLYFWVIVLRDIIIFLGGIFVTSKIGKVLPSNNLGKLTVFIIGVFIILLTIQLKSDNYIYIFFYYLSLLTSFASVISYSIRAINEIRVVENENV